MMTGLIRLRPLTHRQRCLRGINSLEAAAMKVILASEGLGPQRVGIMPFRHCSSKNYTTAKYFINKKMHKCLLMIVLRVN